MTTQKKRLSEREQKEYLLSKKGDSVVFSYPEPPYKLIGKLMDRIVVKSGEDEFVRYWNLIDLIRFENESEDWLRITYYRYKKKEKRWVFAGQTSYADPISQFERLFVNGIREKDWIRKAFPECLQTMCERIGMILLSDFLSQFLSARDTIKE